jgi:hypothetical protein
MNVPKSRSIPVEYIQQCFEYSEEVVDGVLQGNVYWTYREDMSNSWNGKCAGKKAGSVNSKGYLRTTVVYNIFRCSLKIHTIVWILNHGCYPKNMIDHIDRNKTNNLIDNLIDCSTRDNSNNRGATSNASSHFRAVAFVKSMAVRKWRVHVHVNGKKTPAIFFADELEAAEHANKLLIENFGDVKNLYQNDISMGYTNKEYPNMSRHYEPEKVAA